MPQYDLPLEELRSYQAPDREPDDFEIFWADTLSEHAGRIPDVTFEPFDDPLYGAVEVFDVSFTGYADDPVRGWFIVPRGGAPRLPCLVSYVGYGGGRGFPIDHLAPAVAGLAHFVMDTRGQGSAWSVGQTPDPHGAGPHHPGFLTRGIENRESYYYRRVFVDAVRAVAAAAQHPRVDAERIAVGGASQGGGIALAVAGLIPDRVRLLLADVPFLCHYRRGCQLVEATGYSEIVRYLRCHRDRVEQVFGTLAYFDGIHFAPRVRARSLFSVALMDPACPPSTVFAAYNRITAPNDIRIYEYNEHEGGGSFQLIERLRAVQALSA